MVSGRDVHFYKIESAWLNYSLRKHGLIFAISVLLKAHLISVLNTQEFLKYFKQVKKCKICFTYPFLKMFA